MQSGTLATLQAQEKTGLSHDTRSSAVDVRHRLHHRDLDDEKEGVVEVGDAEGGVVEHFEWEHFEERAPLLATDKYTKRTGRGSARWRLARRLRYDSASRKNVQMVGANMVLTGNLETNEYRSSDLLFDLLVVA